MCHILLFDGLHLADQLPTLPVISASEPQSGSDGNNRASIGAGRSSEPGETELVASKWDNHNAIARGWGGMKANYHPVTFREIYNVESQAKEQTTQNL